MTFVVGLTGGIACGKTTVANLFQQHFDIEIVDADMIARQVVEPGSHGLKALREHFGEHILHDDGRLNRAQLRSIIFTNDSEKTWVNQLLHPMIHNEMKNALAKTTSPYALLVVPLLFENQLQSQVNRVLVVDVDEKTQIERTMARDSVSEQQARNIMKAQASRTERLALADDVINNHTENSKLLPQITELHQKYLAMSSKNL